MTSYYQVPGGDRSPRMQPYRRTSGNVLHTELQPLDEPARPPRSRSPSLYQPESYSAYSYNSGYTGDDNDIEQKPLAHDVPPEIEYRRYKRRWFGLAELVLLNFATGWGNAAPGVVSTTATEWFDITYPQLNNLSIASSLVFLVPAPFVIWVLNRHGPKNSMIVACVLTVVGNWIVYVATRMHSFPGNVVGTIIAALSAPFVAAAPTVSVRTRGPGR